MSSIGLGEELLTWIWMQPVNGCKTDVNPPQINRHSLRRGVLVEGTFSTGLQSLIINALSNGVLKFLVLRCSNRSQNHKNHKI